MKACWGVLLFLVVLMSVPFVSAQSIDLRFIPDQISANSGFILVATPSITDEAIRMNWLVGDTENGYGLFPRIGSTWSCYFSNTDAMSTCGPTPFIQQAELGKPGRGIPYELEVNITNTTGSVTGIKEDIIVGGIPINPKININYSTNKVHMIVSILGGKYADSAKYAVYKSDFSLLTSGYSPLSIDIADEKWKGDVTLDKKTYYIAFKVNSSDDFGGGVLRISLGEEVGGETGIVSVDNIDVTALVDDGFYQKGDYRITNPNNSTITGIYATIPTELSSYISIDFPGNKTLGPYESMYYTVTFNNLISSLSASTNVPVYSTGGTQIATISLKAEISVIGSGGTDYSCGGKDDGDYCIGGICCDESCIKKAECCSSLDCTGTSCVENRCSSGAAECSAGSECRTGVSCPDGETYSGKYCTGGVCCEPESTDTNECDGVFEGDSCTGGTCCNGLCLSGAECCSDIGCDVEGGERCDDTYQCSTGAPGSETDIVTILLIALVGGGGGFGLYYYFTKIKKKRDAEEGEEGDEDEDELDDDEFF